MQFVTVTICYGIYATFFELMRQKPIISFEKTKIFNRSMKGQNFKYIRNHRPYSNNRITNRSFIRPLSVPKKKKDKKVNFLPRSLSS